MTKAEQFAKLNGVEWYCYYSDAKSILEVIDKRPDGKLFYAKLMYSGDNVEAIDDDGYIDRDYILNPDKLLDEAIKWCEREVI
jgi:hypothetical protein